MGCQLRRCCSSSVLNDVNRLGRQRTGPSRVTPLACKGVGRSTRVLAQIPVGRGRAVIGDRDRRQQDLGNAMDRQGTSHRLPLSASAKWLCLCRKLDFSVVMRWTAQPQ